MIKTTAFIVLKPEHAYNGKLTGVEVDRMTKTKPGLKTNEVAIQLSIIVEEQLFEQFLPTVEITLGGHEKLWTPKVEVLDAPVEEPVDA